MINWDEVIIRLSTEANNEIDSYSQDNEMDRHYCQSKVHKYLRLMANELQSRVRESE